MTNERLCLALLESRYRPAIGRDSANERLGWLVSSSNRRVSFILLFCPANGRGHRAHSWQADGHFGPGEAWFKSALVREFGT